ncbi:hypothetical protein AB0P17_19875 [Streptomyces sp. NPDC088124]|uniref:hypothetical protein n=1 Tax=Streptomyces sp. NPDC088124 TaxID=3154654 RepID=UPI003415409E
MSGEPHSSAHEPVEYVLRSGATGLCHRGRYAERETALRGHWDRHPEQAWLTDLRNTRY